MSRDDNDSDVFSFVLSPGEDEPLHVGFEPVGPEYEIRQGDHLRIRVTDSPPEDPVEVTGGKNWVTVWSAPSARIQATNAKGEVLLFLIQ
ncbi:MULTISPECIES: hypothetical protein [unclassified Nocardioides]|uniref:hypothetical protein n=1 Tax=unclassified Nocardioides TaxID=2615069 RepID=UPI000702E227|nr:MULTISPECIES: hypothetical protein [unclassified Nocardioides]KRC50016.1 hypothetical protein ASE19_15450 [Nocardioides sp. Root79]KRC75484.1 hypothetical protein ASE20_21470 [Nocardioides sp. Root240]